MKHGISVNLLSGSLEQGQVGVFGSPAVLQVRGRVQGSLKPFWILFAPVLRRQKGV